MRSQTWFLPSCTSLLLACGGDGGGPSGSTATLGGTVTSAATGAAVSGATVTVGSAQATSDADGGFELTGVQPGASVQVACARAGFLAYSVAIAVQEGSNSHDIALAPRELYSSGDFVLYLPGSTTQVRGALVALGGPDTRAFADGRYRAAPEPLPALEASLQTLGEQLRALARDSGFAVLGSGVAGWFNEITNDERVLAALQAAADESGHADLASAPLILFGISGGAPGAFGIVQRQAGRVAAFAMLVPSRLNPFVSPAPHSVPGYVSLAQVDTVVDNLGTTQEFLSNRAAGAIWGLAVEPGRGHAELTVRARTALVNWITTAAGLRLPDAPGGVLRTVQESSGWLGNLTTFDIASYASYGADPRQASWLPTAAMSVEWQALVTP